MRDEYVRGPLERLSDPGIWTLRERCTDRTFLGGVHVGKLNILMHSPVASLAPLDADLVPALHATLTLGCAIDLSSIVLFLPVGLLSF